MTDQLSPAAQAVMIAATNSNFNVVNDPVYRQCIAAALRAAADQVECIDPDDNAFAAGYDTALGDILSIAAELEAS